MEKMTAGQSSGLGDRKESLPDGELSSSDFYQLTEKPFENNLDPKFLYLTPSYQEIFASILNWLKKDSGIAVITGEAGTGKTFFIYDLLCHLDETIGPVLILNPVTSFRELLKQILWILKLPIREETETGLLHHFRVLLDQMSAQGKILLIVLDEAQSLHEQVLNDIDRFLDLRSSPIRIIFVGQPHLIEKLHMHFKQAGLKMERVQNFKRFTREESRGYIDHRLRMVGSSSKIISSKAVSMICSYSQGSLTTINHVCDNALRLGCNMNRKKITLDIIEKVIQNLEGPRILPRIFLSIQLRRIWEFAGRLAISFERLLVKSKEYKPGLPALRVIPNVLPSIWMRRIWNILVQFLISFKREASTFISAIFHSIKLEKLIQNLEGPRILPRIFLSIHLRRVWEFAGRLAISFERLLAKSKEYKPGLPALRVIPNPLPSIGIGRIWKILVQFFISFKRAASTFIPTTLHSIELFWESAFQFIISKRVGIAVLLKPLRNLVTPTVISKTSPRIEFKWIRKSPMNVLPSFRRALSETFLRIQIRRVWVKMSLPEFLNRLNSDSFKIIRKFIPSIRPRSIGRRIQKSPPQFAVSLRRASIFISLLICLGGIIFLIHQLIERGGLVEIQVMNPSTGEKSITAPFAQAPPFQDTTRKIVKKDRIQDPGEIDQHKSPPQKREIIRLTPRKVKQESTEAKAKGTLNVIPMVNEKTSSPPLESGYKKDQPVEAKHTHEISNISKDQVMAITHFSASDRGPYGCIWQIYIEAEDPEGDMDRISVQVDQVNHGRYPTEWIMLKPQYRKHLKGFLQWNTFSSKASHLLEGTQISVRISIFDRAGNRSNEITIPFTFESGVTRRHHVPPPFDNGNVHRIGYVMVDLSA